MSNPRNQSFTFEWDIGKQITYQPVNMAKPSIPVKVEFEVISKEDKKTWEPEIQQRMMDAMKDVFSAGVTVIGKLMMETDRQLSLSRTPLVVDCIRILKNFERECREQTRFLENRAKMAAQQEWDALLRTKEQYRNYQLKTGWQIGSSVVGIVLGISSAITASPPGELRMATFRPLGAVRWVKRDAMSMRSPRSSAITRCDCAAAPRHSFNDPPREPVWLMAALPPDSVNPDLQAIMGFFPRACPASLRNLRGSRSSSR